MADESIREVPLPAGWEGLSIKLRGDRCIVSEVPKACFSSAAFASSGAAKPQVDGVQQGDEVVSINGEAPAKLIQRIGTSGDSWNACSSASPPHAVGSKTKFDSPPCAACDFIRIHKKLGFDVALQMWMRAVKREIKIVLGVRAGSAIPEGDDKPTGALAPLQLDTAAPARSGDTAKVTSALVEVKASSESESRLEAALARLQKLDDMTRKKHNESKGKGKGKGKGKAKKGKRPSGPDLPRTRLTSELVTGEVSEWKGKYGWIKPHKPVDHPKAGAHKGRLYVHQVDLEWWVKELKQGCYCRFHVYSDANSLGAEECTLLGEESAASDVKLTEYVSDWKDASGDDRDWKAEEWEGHGSWDVNGAADAGGESRGRSRSRGRRA